MSGRLPLFVVLKNHDGARWVFVWESSSTICETLQKSTEEIHRQDEKWHTSLVDAAHSDRLWWYSHHLSFFEHIAGMASCGCGSQDQLVSSWLIGPNNWSMPVFQHLCLNNKAGCGNKPSVDHSINHDKILGITICRFCKAYSINSNNTSCIASSITNYINHNHTN